MHASLQRKFSFSYIAIILAVLILLNTYPLITSENLTFRSKQSSLQGSVSVMVTALSGLEELSEENVAGAMTLVEETGISRVLVTDASGRVLYDTRETDGAIGRYAFYTELVQALRGEDVFYTEFSDKAFKSRAASPVIYHSQTIGAVYAYEYDTEQAELLLSLQRNLLTISAGVLVFAGRGRRQARGQAQATGNAVQVITGKHQVPPVTAAVPAACTDKVKWLPCRQPRALGQRSGRFGTARFCHRRTSSGVCSPSAMARTALKALSTMLATFTSV